MSEGQIRNISSIPIALYRHVNVNVFIQIQMNFMTMQYFKLASNPNIENVHPEAQITDDNHPEYMLKTRKSYPNATVTLV